MENEAGKSPEHGKSVEIPEPPPAYSTTSTPCGLERLMALERIDVHHRNVTTEHGEVIFTQKRELTKKGLSYAIRFDLYDQTGRMVISFHPIQGCINGRLEVFVEGELVSMLRIKSLFTCSPTYIITDAQKNKALKIRAPKFGQTNFVLTLKDMQGEALGVVTKKWNGLGEELFADSNVFEISFPKELPVPYKAAVIGFCVLIAQSANLQYQSS